jgi:hypothetical protein
VERRIAKIESTEERYKQQQVVTFEKYNTNLEEWGENTELATNQLQRQDRRIDELEDRLTVALELIRRLEKQARTPAGEWIKVLHQ